MSEELDSKYTISHRITGQKLVEFEYFQLGSTTFNQLSLAKLAPPTFDTRYSSHKPDRIIIDRRNKTPKVITVIEDKKSGKFNSDIEIQKAVRQCNTYCQELKAKFGVITDGSTTLWINPWQEDPSNTYQDPVTGEDRSYSYIKDEAGRTLKRDFYYDERSDMTEDTIRSSSVFDLYTLLKKIYLDINIDNSQIVPNEGIDPLELATRVWQDIWVATGKSPEKCLYNVVELFIFKFLSDLDVLSEGFDKVWQQVEDKVDPKDVLRYYVKISREEIVRKFERGKDGTTIINGTIFVNEHGEPNLSQAFLFVNTIKKFKEFERKNGKFSNKNIDKKFKTELYEKFLKQTSGLKALGQYFTPRKVVQAIVEIARSDIQNLRPGDTLCDPFCGVGGFVLEPINLARQSDFIPKQNSIDPPINYLGFDKGFEKDEERTIILAKANMLIYLADIISNDKGLPTSELAKVFNDTFHLLQTNLGTLGELSYRDSINLILTNPPYVTSGSRTIKNEIEADSDTSKFYNVNAAGIEGLALEWIIRSLKPDGRSRAFVIVPDGILNRLNDKKLRAFILKECFIDAIISLPSKTFFTTPKKTYILVITRKSTPQDAQTYPVFAYLASSIGETLDVNRFEIPENDLTEMTKLFKRVQVDKYDDDVIEQYKDESPRCKLYDIDSFDPNMHWSIDRWWTKDERISLGIEKEESTKSAEEFFEEIEDSAQQLLELSKQKDEILKKKFKSSSKYKTVSISDPEFFRLAIGERLLKKDLVLNVGNPAAVIPVYSANVFEPFGYLEKSNIKRFENPYVLWGIDGNFDLSYKSTESVFATTDHCGTIEILDKNIDPQYLLYILNLKKLIYGFDRGLRSNLVNVKRIEIEIPIDSDGNIDISRQRLVVEKNNQLSSIKNSIRSVNEEILQSNVSFDDEFNGVEVPLSDIIDFSANTNSSSFTKAFVNRNSGDIPVYSASDNLNFAGYGYVRDNLPSIKYFENCMTWNIDGSVGRVFIRSGRFTLSEKVIPLLVESELADSIDQEFLKYTIEKCAKQGEFGFSNKAGKSRLKKVIVKIPTNDDGTYDIQAQRDLAQKYKSIEKLSSEVTDILQAVLNDAIEIPL